MDEVIKERIEKINNGQLPPNYKQENRTIFCSDWGYKEISEVMEIRNNLRIPVSEEDRKSMQGIYPYYGPTRIQDYIDRYTVEGEHVLIGEDGDHFLKYKEKQMTLLVDGKFNVNNHAHILKGTGKCTTKWFYYYYQHRNLFDSLTRQGAGRYKLTKDALGKMKIAVPTVEEQKKVINVLSTWDKAIELKEKLIEEKKKLKSGLMQKLLTGKVRLLGFDGELNYVSIDGHIKEVKIKNKASKETRVLSVTNKQGFILQEEQFERVVASKDLTNYKIVKNGQFAYNPSRVNVGSIDQLKNFDSGLLSPMYVVFECTGELVSSYFYHFIKSDMFLNVIPNMLQGSVRDSLSFDSLKLIKLFIPSLEEQMAIAEVLNTADKEITLIEKELESLKQQKKGLMQLLLTGIVRVNVDTN